MTEDNKIKFKAIDLLDNFLSETKEFSKDSGIEKKQLINMYIESRDLLRQNLHNSSLNKLAQSLFATCIRIVSFYEIIGEQSKDLLIDTNIYSLEAKELYQHALKLYSELNNTIYLD
jgi:hypothetical protein